ncbi:MAG: multifunctional CCA tRNA nucleotidyl transferase/2'3'-cyclic phosphodiesterase/2'nucleotidase/phosphatase, partial [Gammaproteobacteria bacterium]|nr:multifunctional CCA tRNA nucleotidyl transferase/2'3'-cyclic phosphodiesterase/2'nucleotidase/phosphatase [Gammaproteobacteria bacterium]
MNTYLVGGAVRDQLLGRPVTERDWLVTGITGEKLAALGFKPVGKEFRIFLHQKTKEEYALPRGEAEAGDEQKLVEQDL